ncbi:toxin glutamine deamidase domain-containing protein [Lewinella sp. LCG006]|uniref:toxin glutamine deamidase domain-containing protein n=1 Tax=Lewinella sp. LCG006 TaxID=3231911 RepID=UPI00345F537B
MLGPNRSHQKPRRGDIKTLSCQWGSIGLDGLEADPSNYPFADALAYGNLIDDVFRPHGRRAWYKGNTVETLAKRFQGFGDGATGVVFGYRGRVGHFFNVRNNNGTIEFLDFQKSGSAIMNSSELTGFKDFWVIKT